jgi:hypothetical protein
MGEMRNYAKIWSENLEQRTLGRPRHRWKDRITMDLQEIRWEDMDGLASSSSG